MVDKSQQAFDLVHQKKYKKALQILKKLNSKAASTTYVTLELEGVCQLHEKKYQMAEIVLKRALAKATTSEQQCNALLNLRTAAYSQQNIENSINYLIKLLAIDGSYKQAEYRLQLAQLLFDQKKFQQVIEYAKPLHGLSDFAVPSIVVTILSYVQIEQFETVIPLYSKLKTDIHLLTAVQAKLMVESLLSLPDNHLIKTLLVDIESRFSHEDWYQNALKRTEQTKVNKKAPKTKNVEPTETVICDDSQTSELIEKLIQQLVDQGGYFSPHLKFVSQQGDLSIQSYTEPQVEAKQMQVPLTCMPLLSDYSLSIEKGVINCESKANPLNPKANEVMATMIALYNATDKINRWQTSYPLLVLKEHPELINFLLKGLSQNPKLSRYLAWFNEKKWDQLALSSFIGAREFKYKKERLNKANIVTENDSESGLLAIIDFLNHQHGGASYQIADDTNYMEINAAPDMESKELFVQYNLLEPLRTYLIYGYVDRQVPFIFSQECSLELSNGLKLHVKNLPGYAPKDVVGEDLHLRHFLPASIKRRSNEITASHLVIPKGSAKNTLAQVLAAVLKKCDAEGFYTNELNLNQAVKELEQQLINNNVAYWKELRGLFIKDIESSYDDELAIGELDTLITIYENTLSEYAKYRKLTLS